MPREFSSSPDALRRAMMAGPTGRVNTPTLPEFITKEWLPKAEPRPATDPTSVPRSLYNTFIQPVSSLGGAAFEGLSNLVPGGAAAKVLYASPRRLMSNQLRGENREKVKEFIKYFFDYTTPEKRKLGSKSTLSVGVDPSSKYLGHMSSPDWSKGHPRDVTERIREGAVSPPVVHVNLKSPDLEKNPLDRKELERTLNHELEHANQFYSQMDALDEGRSPLSFENKYGAGDSPLDMENAESYFRYWMNPYEIGARRQEHPSLPSAAKDWYSLAKDSKSGVRGIRDVSKGFENASSNPRDSKVLAEKISEMLRHNVDSEVYSPVAEQAIKEYREDRKKARLDFLDFVLSRSLLEGR